MGTKRIRVENLNFPANVAAGCNFLVVASLAHMLRGTTGDPEPVLVRWEAPGRYSITDGRHRTLAAIIAGRPDVLCREEGREHYEQAQEGYRD